MNVDLWNRCMLSGYALDYEVSLLEGTECKPYSTDWSLGGPIIERDHIFLNAPTTEHITGGPNAGWHEYDFWRATVSANTRTRPNPSGSTIAPTTVGRGMGPTALIASMRAFVDSFVLAENKN